MDYEYNIRKANLIWRCDVTTVK